MNNILYVNHLGQVDLSEIESLFSLVGDVVSQRLEVNQLSSRGASFGVFAMATDQQAQNCIERYHGSYALGRTLSVSDSKPEGPKVSDPVPVRRRRAKKN